MSKVGTKHGAIACDPVLYLKHFGETECLLDQDAALAEKYLVRVWAGPRSATDAETFDQLRQEMYSAGRHGIDSLPPTSSVVSGHIKRGHFLVNKACQLLHKCQERPQGAEHEYGWEEHFGVLLPSKSLKALPQHLLVTCKCTGNCDRRRCRCHLNELSSVTFCQGK